MNTFTGISGEKYEISKLHKYIKEHLSAPYLGFRGLESFIALYDEGLIQDGHTIIRIDDGNVGLNYLVLSKTHLKGEDSPAYEGPQGIHKIEDCFKFEEHFSVDNIFIPKKYGIRNIHWGIFDEDSEKYKHQI